MRKGKNLNQVEIFYNGEVVSVPKEVADFLEQDRKRAAAQDKRDERYLRQHRTIAEASAVESPIRQETIGFPAHFFARAHNFKPPGRACQPEADSPTRI